MNREFDGFVAVVDSIANNDLTKDIIESELEDIGVDSTDEIGVLAGAIEDTLIAKGKIGTSFNKMKTNLVAAMRNLGQGSDEVSQASASTV